ncbi:MAG: hypothetical protein QM726_03785 [Chitinophagaceae bacterium]
MKRILNFTVLAVLLFAVGCKKESTKPESIDDVLQDFGVAKINNYVPANGEKVITVQSVADLRSKLGEISLPKSQGMNLQVTAKKNDNMDGSTLSISDYGGDDGGPKPTKYNVTMNGSYGAMNASVTIFYNANPGGVGGVNNVSVATSMVISPGIGSYTQDSQYSVTVSSNGDIIVFEVTGTYTAGINTSGMTIGATYSYDFTGYYDTSTKGGSTVVKQTPMKKILPK